MDMLMLTCQHLYVQCSTKLRTLVTESRFHNHEGKAASLHPIISETVITSDAVMGSSQEGCGSDEIAEWYDYHNQLYRYLNASNASPKQ
ncbi:hypothetical protein BBBOND_0209700 [Babesia bigemina]|uniref:Uncharacterized protein n=1 Tax=Babesia bigemina TaxID=5866 RepID=A0A061D5K0_BABBI|nr:hypothetical protein BBBOND_0209660 [Babesia bigemina]XP_012768003.1 hypothetical protein BBBOND_0209700 [Babesia bigemina]CDR95813.1 hypothetical protein BBBOND_0209660 [Babesia bigemina]CDR95817.1 hypothetical protein BBBOND_0209700 [Babesia bigemina]|eukprot:XP_012767999.1 hypothetical protein BBBOND_0209660 [Babesia bigemina]